MRGLTSDHAEIKNILLRLRPYENKEQMFLLYQKKKKRWMIGLIVVGIVSALYVHGGSQKEKRLLDGNLLVRNVWDAGNYQVDLNVKTKEWDHSFSYLVKEKAYTREEAEQLYRKFAGELPSLICGGNQTLQEVTEDLKLANAYKDYPFMVSWSSTDQDRVSSRGKVNRKGLEDEGQWVTLHALVREVDTGLEQELTLKVFLAPEKLSEEELFFRRVEESVISMDKVSAQKEIVTLPVSVEGKELTWKETKQDHSIFILLLFGAASLFVGRAMDHDLQKADRKRLKELQKEYPEFAGRLRLYLCAGMTARNAFGRVAQDYAERTGKKKRLFLESEMKIACNQLSNGLPEAQVYQEWGARCGEMRYRRLGFLLSVQLKQGNDRLLQLLEQEADVAREDQRNQARKEGEEAGTKLLFPMILILIMVMLLVLLPAYVDFGTI
ncbi:putative uncharacterized protein [Firmicutes bacterium CAG:534]|nr:putative uncharacterized protein [Firmicutes bacterium CAG:534]